MYVPIMIEKRKTKTITIDPRVWEVVEKQAKKQGIAASRWLENHLFGNFQSLGLLDQSLERLGEIRGGDRSK